MTISSDLKFKVGFNNGWAVRRPSGSIVYIGKTRQQARNYKKDKARNYKKDNYVYLSDVVKVQIHIVKVV